MFDPPIILGFYVLAINFFYLFIQSFDAKREERKTLKTREHGDDIWLVIFQPYKKQIRREWV